MRATYIAPTEAGFEEEKSTIDARILLLFVAVFALTFAVMMLLVSFANVTDHKLLPPCQTEDSTSCYWDSDTMGNGQGQDVVNQ